MRALRGAVDKSCSYLVGMGGGVRLDLAATDPGSSALKLVPGREL